MGASGDCVRAVVGASGDCVRAVVGASGDCGIGSAAARARSAAACTRRATTQSEAIRRGNQEAINGTRLLAESNEFPTEPSELPTASSAADLLARGGRLSLIHI